MLPTRRPPTVGSISCATIRGCAAPQDLAPGTRSSGRIESRTPQPRRPATSPSRVTASITSRSVSRSAVRCGGADLPADPVDRLAVLAPALGRLVTTTGASVLDAIAGRTPGITRALLSSAARRALRPGPARTALTADGAAPFGAVLVGGQRMRGPPRSRDHPPHRQRSRQRDQESHHRRRSWRCNAWRPRFSAPSVTIQAPARWPPHFARSLQTRRACPIATSSTDSSAAKSFRSETGLSSSGQVG